MPRYIDADNFRKTMIKRFGCVPCLTDYSDTARYDIPIDDALELETTADVVQRSEVARLEDHNKQLRYDVKKIRTEARKEFAERLHKVIDSFREKREMVMLPYTEAALLYVEKNIDNLVEEMEKQNER